jgi:hypothetical protein
MSMPRGRWHCAAGCLAAVVLTACGSHSSPAATTQAGTSPPTASAPLQQPAATPGAALPDADERACAGVQAILGHISVDTARWSPTFRPFDRGIATRLETQTGYLSTQALDSSAPLREAVAATAAAFDDVSRAIMAKDRPRLDRAIAHSRTAYSALKNRCAFSN